MNRIAFLAAAAALVALPASAQSTSAQSIRISTVGKSAEQVRTEVHLAANKLCTHQIVGSTFPAEEMRACVSRTVRTTLAQSSDPQLKLASR